MSWYPKNLTASEIDEFGLPLDLGIEWTEKQRDAVARLVAVMLCELHGIDPFDGAEGKHQWQRFHGDARAMVDAHPWCGEKVPSA